ncbi:MAG: tautomerase family protein [Clostridia bacterium]|nr:tautomerase family protein [Clostridia bacterium]
MPHIVVKWYKGRTEEEKKEFAQKILEEATRITGRGAEHFSVAIEDYEPSEWMETVYKPEIMDKEETLYIKPGYGPLSEKE